MSNDNETTADSGATWPVGGGAMGKRIQAHDWGQTALGGIDSWRQSLRSTVDMVLGADFPMLAIWGDGEVQFFNDAYAELIDDASPDMLGRTVREGKTAFNCVDTSIRRRVFAGETVTQKAVGLPASGNGQAFGKWFDVTCRPARDDDGSIIGVLVTGFDITQHVVGKRLLSAEVQHRVRNNLSVIRSITRRTAENSETLEAFSSHLDGRIGAFARAQSAATGSSGGGVDLHSIILDEMSAYTVQEGEQFTLTGPEIRVYAKAAETLTLAFHELATNAVKFGALTVEEGSIAVSWRIEGKTFRIAWQEEWPGQSLSQPAHSGFGTELLESTLAYELDAKTVLEFRPNGLCCTIDLPLKGNLQPGS